jgi:hypothetical protein
LLALTRRTKVVPVVETFFTPATVAGFLEMLVKTS